MEASSDHTPELTNFDLFVAALSVLSLVNIVLVLLPLSDQATDVVLIVDVALCAIFLADFFLRLKRAPSKREYVVHDKGWLDFLGSLPLPGVRVFRLFRIARVAHVLRVYGVRGLLAKLNADRAGTALYLAVFLAIIVLQFGSMFMIGAEKEAPNANIHTASDALWWSYVSITTVGYGDRYPVTNTGRMVGIVTITIGVGLFGVITGFLANLFLAPKKAAAKPDDQPQAPTAVDMERKLDQLIVETHALRDRLAREDRR
jgi:voltage-gated potassium channel